MIYLRSHRCLQNQLYYIHPALELCAGDDEIHYLMYCIHHSVGKDTFQHK